MNSFTIESKDEGQRLDRFVSRILSAAPKSFIFKALRNKDIRLNGKKADGKEELKAGDVVLFRFPDVQFESLSGKKTGERKNAGSETGERKTADSENGEQKTASGKNEGSENGGSETGDSKNEGSKTADSKTGDSNTGETSVKSRLSNYCKIVFEDDDIIIADKKEGVLSQKSTPSDISLNEVLLSYAGGGDAMFTPSVCNRLDRNTSGLITFAKTYRGVRELNSLFRGHDLEKYYLAMVRGEVKEEGHVYGTFSKDRRKNTVTITIKEPDGGYDTETAYEPLSTKTVNGKQETLLLVRLYTGKSHQIRATLAALGHPVLGDLKYGSPESAHAARRLMLHSYRMVIPGRGTFTAENKDFM